MNVSKAIRTKRAVRQYTEESVSDDVIRQILATARWSQSSKNTQPWDFFVITDKDLLAELSQSGDFAKHLPSAAFAIALVGDSDNYMVGFDLGQTAMSLQLAAWEVGIGSCLISFHRAEQAAEILGVPEVKYVRIGISFGYPSPEHKAAKMGGRQALDDITHWNNW
ncbi:MAG: nitroreductase family protein [Anaerolineae bacterium]|nr:nitroreductase family protein [Anaerolineae bacterium]MDQ7035481.1 nitroreductase family protein [Anaerolineae bacterium]